MALNRAKVIEKKKLTEDVYELNLERLDSFDFEAGQYISVKINDEIATPCMRAYSISSPPSNSNFSLCIKVTEGGRGSNWLKSLEKNDEIEFLGPMGNFTFKNVSKNAFFIATGTGVAPFCSIIEEELKKGFLGKISLLFGLRHINGIFYKEFFEKLETEYSNFDFNMILSRPEDENYEGNVGRVTDFLKTADLDTKNTDFYLCGLSPMINEVSALLAEKGVGISQIHFEKYD